MNKLINVINTNMEQGKKTYIFRTDMAIFREDTSKAEFVACLKENQISAVILKVSAALTTAIALAGVLEGELNIPVILESNFHPIFLMGMKEFTKELKDAGLIQGVKGDKGDKGDAGEDGQMGLTSYNAGEWDPLKEYLKNDLLTPFVAYNGKYYILVGTATKGTAPVYDTTNWSELTHYQSLFTNLLIAENGTLGQFYFSGDYMFSTMGQDLCYDEEEGWLRSSNVAYNDVITWTDHLIIDFANQYVFTDVNPTDESEYYWAPYYWVNQKTGEVCAQNAKFSGEIVAKKGTIAGPLVASAVNAVSHATHETTLSPSGLSSKYILSNGNVLDECIVDGGQISVKKGGVEKFLVNHEGVYSAAGPKIIFGESNDVTVLIDDGQGEALIGSNLVKLECDWGATLIEATDEGITLQRGTDSSVLLKDDAVTLQFGDIYFSLSSNGIHTNTNIIKD